MPFCPLIELRLSDICIITLTGPVSWQVHFCALVGLPMNRVMASIPMAASLMSWCPLNGKHPSVIYWRNQALGTSLAMGFFLNNGLISDQVAEEQVQCQPNGEIFLYVFVYGWLHLLI